MPLPPLTPLSYAVLSELITGPRSGRDLRTALKEKHQHKKTGPAFYQLMARLEGLGLVSGAYHTIRVGDQDVREKRYTMSGEGVDALNDTRAFYAATEIDGQIARAY